MDPRGQINMEETIGKTVGRRTKIPPGYGLVLQRSLAESFRYRIPRGVYKFTSHEEADQWLMDHLIRKPGS